MKVLNPLENNHTVKIEPRKFPNGDVFMYVKKDALNDEVLTSNCYAIYGGVMSLEFDLIGKEGERYTFKIVDNGEVIYRGFLFFTEQKTQEYKQSKNKYIYV